MRVAFRVLITKETTESDGRLRAMEWTQLRTLTLRKRLVVLRFCNHVSIISLRHWAI